jgi:hypothetical protein
MCGFRFLCSDFFPCDIGELFTTSPGSYIVFVAVASLTSSSFVPAPSSIFLDGLAYVKAGE